MDSFVFIIFLLLCLALALSVFRKGDHVLKIKLLRLFIVLGATAFFTYWFVQRSLPGFMKDSMVIQIINKLPQPVDFYVLKVKDAKAEGDPYVLRHSGKIRPEHYRTEYLKMNDSGEYWIVGYIGKKNMVYFSQHAVPNKNMDQIVEVKNYINQSMKLSETAGKIIEKYRKSDMQSSVWVTLSLLLIFLNFMLLATRK